MVNHLLDSNVCVEWLRKKGNVLVKARLAATPPTEIRMCSVVLGELLHGAEVSANPSKNRSEVLAFTGQYRSLPYGDPEAAEYARIRAQLGSLGLMIGHYDLMIAAIALTHKLTLVTHNTSEFSRLPGLQIVDWEHP
jgi:tRNA(fMet)-specific endonuclease VapC